MSKKDKKNIKKAEDLIKKKESALNQKEKELEERESSILTLKKHLYCFLMLICVLFLAIFIVFFVFLFKFNQWNSQQKAFINNLESSTISVDDNNLRSQYDDFVYSIFYVDGDYYLDKNGNTFYFDLDCTAGNEITTPIFASRKSFSMRNSNGDSISVYLLKDGKLAYIPSHKNVDIRSN